MLFEYPDRVTMVRRLINAEADNLLGCDSQLALPEILFAGFKGYGTMGEEELKAEYCDMFNVGSSDADIEYPNEVDAPDFDDFGYFESSSAAWDKEFEKSVEVQKKKEG
jgi:hypothetical protein